MFALQKRDTEKFFKQRSCKDTMVEILENVEHIVFCAMLFTLVTAIGIFCINATSINNIANYEFSFNYHNWKKINTSETILGIITTSAAIVAIGFSINHITFSKVFQTYSSRNFQI